MDVSLKEFREKHSHGRFTYKEALAFGITRGEFYKLVRSGKFERVQRGYYQLYDYFPSTMYHQFRDISKRLNYKAAICLQTALTFYELSDEFINVPSLLVDNTTYSHDKTIHLFRKRKPHWDKGINEEDGFLITSIERTIVESMVYKKWAGWEGIKALRLVLKEKKTDIYKISKIAKELGYYKRIEKNLEVFF